MLYVRILGPEGTGKYAFVVAIYGLFEIISRYGLGTLLTRDVAADKNQSSRYLTNVLALRTLLWLASLPVLALVTYGYRVIGQVEIVNATSIAGRPNTIESSPGIRSLRVFRLGLNHARTRKSIGDVVSSSSPISW